MANRKLQISDEERRQRRAAQLRKSTYRCPECRFTFQAKRGLTSVVCGLCVVSQICELPGHGGWPLMVETIGSARLSTPAAAADG